MSSTAPVIVCECGFRLRAAGATPGRVGRCPRCLATITIPKADEPEPEPEIVEEPAPPPPRGRPRVFNEGYDRPAKSRNRPAPEVAGAATSFSANVEHPTVRSKPELAPFKDGLIATPKSLEANFFESLKYPLWGAAGVQMLTLMPTLLWITSLPSVVLTQAIVNSASYRLPAYVLMLPFSLGSLYLLGHVLYFLGEVLTTSSCGEIHVPRRPPWDVDTIRRCTIRWTVSMLIGCGIGWFPAAAYWVEFGGESWADRMIIANLMSVGGAYSIMALLASLLFDDPLAANPFTVVPALRRAGWAFAGPCILVAGAGSVLYWLLSTVTTSDNPAVAGFGLWFFWVIAIYTATILFRRLGLFCHERRVRDLWFPDRPRIGR